MIELVPIFLRDVPERDLREAGGDIGREKVLHRNARK
jgi:hypothetical protein